MRSLSVATLVVAAACNGGSSKATTWVDSGYRDGAPDALPPYWEPTAGNVKYWDIQLAPPFDLTTPPGQTRDMYVLPLWALVPAATTIDYGDGTTVDVPKGALGDAYAGLRARRPQPRIICEFGTGSVDLTEPDATKFPGFEANPPDDPVPPKAGSVIGWSTTLRPHRRWLDVREPATGSQRPTIVAILQKRVDLAKSIGCDGILPDDNGMFQLLKNDGSGPAGSGTGFVDPAPITTQENQDWYTEVATMGHTAVLSVGARGAYAPLSGFFAPIFDFLIADRCGEYMDCDMTREFANARKAVLALEFDHTLEGAAQNVGATCGQESGGNSVLNGIVKDVALSSTYYYACADFMMP